MHKLEDLIIWKKAIELTKQVYLICLELPQDEKFGLNSQIKRAAISIPSNIANGSSYELMTQLILGIELQLFKKDKTEHIILLLNEIQKMNYVFQQKLKSRI